MSIVSVSCQCEFQKCVLTREFFREIVTFTSKFSYLFFARLRHYTENDRDRFKSKEVAIPELLETIVKLKLENDQSTTSAPSGSLMRIDSASRIPETTSVPQFSIEWSHMEKYLEDRKNAHLKRRLDASIRAKMLPILSSFVSSTDIQVFVLPLKATIMSHKIYIIDNA